ncbi:MAG: DUF5683 domain-containing protein [Rikenellaceae bacterium]
MSKSENILKWFNIFTVVMVVALSSMSVSAQVRRSVKSTISGGVMITPPEHDSTAMQIPDSVLRDSVLLNALLIDSLGLDSLVVDSLRSNPAAMEALISQGADSLLLHGVDSMRVDSISRFARSQSGAVKERKKLGLFSDSMSLSTMCWTATLLPGYGQVYNKQYWKLPILYGTLGASIALFVNENKRYQPLKEQYDAMTLTDLNRTDELDALQGDMIRSNTKRQLYIGAMAASYIYFLGDAAVNYSTNDVSSVKKATTLAMICPGAGQIYNKSYWKLPFVVGGFATMIYVIDWNSRGYSRFKKAYALRYDFDENPDNYPDGVSLDEFGGRYTASYLKSIRNSYRRNRDLCIIMTAGLYILQIIDAHVDAHLRDYDISDDLTMNIDPMIQSGYSPTSRSDYAAYGFNINLKF